MRLSALALVAVAAQAAAKPHRHSHRHTPHRVAKQAPNQARYVAATETVVLYEFEGHLIPEDEVRKGIANGTWSFDSDGNLSSSAAVFAEATPAPEQTQAPKQEPEPESQPVQDPVPSEPAAESAPPESTQSQVPPVVAPTAASAQPASAPSTSGAYQPLRSDGTCPDCEKVFPNGTIPCSAFPTGYGAVHLRNEGLGGWTGIQDPTYHGADGMDNIYTVVKGSCDDGSCCTPGRFCSYSCPNPYLKMSWPMQQGRTKQSVGGLFCNDQGYLEMADGSLSNTLCGQGSDKVKVKVQNKLSQSVSICRTDYPGTESETLPFTLGPGESGELANPDQEAYWHWDNKPTSAQYYVNSQGVPENEACTWGTGAQAVGNWAPTIFGTSFAGSEGFSSLFQNAPTNGDDRLNFTITFIGEGVTNPCKYKHSTGEYCNGDSCSRDKGCTASIKSGTDLILVFTD